MSLFAAFWKTRWRSRGKGEMKRVFTRWFAVSCFSHGVEQKPMSCESTGISLWQRDVSEWLWNEATYQIRNVLVLIDDWASHECFQREAYEMKFHYRLALRVDVSYNDGRAPLVSWISVIGRSAASEKKGQSIQLRPQMLPDRWWMLLSTRNLDFDVFIDMSSGLSSSSLEENSLRRGVRLQRKKERSTCLSVFSERGSREEKSRESCLLTLKEKGDLQWWYPFQSSARQVKATAARLGRIYKSMYERKKGEWTNLVFSSFRPFLPLSLSPSLSRAVYRVRVYANG